MKELTFLKVKIKSLAEEAKIIKLEEKRNKLAREELYLHRIQVVRTEARATLLAYGFLRGRKYRELENSGTMPPNIKSRIIKMIDKYYWEKFDNRRDTIDKKVSDWLSEPTV